MTGDEIIKDHSILEGNLSISINYTKKQQYEVDTDDDESSDGENSLDSEL